MAVEVPQRFEHSFCAHPQLFAGVRSLIAAQLRVWRRNELITPAAMCVTELLSNVVKHARAPECVLTMANSRAEVRIGVADTEPALPVVKEPDYFAESGRGMFLLANTADDWGVVMTDTGKTVWCTIRTTRTADA